MSDGSSQQGGHAPRGRITGPSTRVPIQGRTVSMVPSRSSSGVGVTGAASPVDSPATSRSSTPQPSASRIQFRPVMPQRRRTPSAQVPPVKKEPEQQSKPARSTTRSTPRPPRELTATGPFALGTASSSSASRKKMDMYMPLQSSTPVTTSAAAPPPAAAAAAAAAAPGTATATDTTGVDIELVHELDDMAPQSLLKAPPSLKREPSPTKAELPDTPADVNESQALDLSDNEDDAEEEMTSFLSSSLQSGQPSGQLFLFQFPQTALSFQHAEGPKAENDTDAPVEGLMGQLDVYPNGRIVLRIGDMPFEVAGGSESSFLQQVMLLDADRQSALCLGELSGKVVVTPQLDYLMEHALGNAP